MFTPTDLDTANNLAPHSAMIVSLEPKKAFQKNEDHAKEFRALVDSVAFKVSCHNAIAEFVLKYHPTTEELQGVCRFIPVLLNMGEKEDPQERAPLMQSIATVKPQPK